MSEHASLRPARPSALRVASDDEAADSFDVPAAVLCAACGRADCAGCEPANEHESGVVAIVPWERPGAGGWTRFWATARATTQGADAFFAALPDGDVPPAVRFALLAEALAVTSMLAVLLPLVGLALPGLAITVLADPDVRLAAIRWVALAIPALTLWMVAAHATHGAALDLGARRNGGRAARRRALRFGLYACGWDVMAGPLGALVTLASRGLGGMRELMRARIGVPGRSARAFLQGVYGLGPDQAARAGRVGTAAAALITVASAAALLLLLAVA